MPGGSELTITYPPSTLDGCRQQNRISQVGGADVGQGSSFRGGVLEGATQPPGHVVDRGGHGLHGDILEAIDRTLRLGDGSVDALGFMVGIIVDDVREESLASVFLGPIRPWLLVVGNRHDG